ncbi:MAG TPA: SGNH/GDSL hydrolase family protein [Candidatus Binatia bacterium]|jgi:lysophospholipase L1-like esterase|nr:SGNH/GDSL hydrolase family protein [Candidatus Binatia bacterium]
MVAIRLLALALAVTACGPPAGVRDVDGDGRIVVACLGDSNTETRWPPPHTPKWCEFAAERVPAWTFTNHAVGGATVTRPNDQRSFADAQLDAAGAAAPADAVVLAFGTNDVRSGRSTADIVAAYRAVVARVEATGAIAFVALAPPSYPPEPDHAAALAALNAALRGAFPPDRLVDFDGGMTRLDFEADGLHPNAAGQHERAVAALRALRPPS